MQVFFEQISREKIFIKSLYYIIEKLPVLIHNYTINYIGGNYMQNEIEVKIPFWGKNQMFYIYSAFIGLFGGVGFYSLISVSVSDISTNPISWPGFLILGFISFSICLSLFGLYISNFTYMKKKLQIILHLLTLAACFVIGVPFTGLMYDLIKTIIKPFLG